MGMAKTTAFNSTSFPPWDRSFSFQAYKCCHSLLQISNNALSSRPFNDERKVQIFHILLDALTVLKSQNLLCLQILFNIPTKNYGCFVSIYVLARCKSILLKQIQQLLGEVLLSSHKIRLSSVNNKWFIAVGASQQTLIPTRLLCIADFWGKLTNPFVHKRKRQGYKRSSCLNPLLGMIDPLGTSLTNMEKKADLTHCMIRSINLCGKPNTESVYLKQSRSSLS